MARRFKADSLPEGAKILLDEALKSGEFSGGYAALESALREMGCSIGKSSIGRYRQHLEKTRQVERAIESVQHCTDAAEDITNAAPDDSGHRSDGILAVLHAELFHAVLAAQDKTSDPAERIELLNKASLAMARLGITNIRMRKFQAEAQAKLDKEIEAMRDAGMDGDTLDAMQSRIRFYLPENGR